jgi:signal transduction histidine kinase
MTMASHELKSPLASVTAHVEMVREDHGDILGEDFRRDLATIERRLRRLRRMNRLTQDLLDHAKADRPMNQTPCFAVRDRQ